MTDTGKDTRKRPGILELVSGTAIGAGTGFFGWVFHIQPTHMLDQAKAVQQATATGELARNALQIAGLAHPPSHTNEAACEKYRGALAKAVNGVKRSVTIQTIDKVELGVIAVGAGLAAGYLINKWRNYGVPSPENEAASSEQSHAYRQLMPGIARNDMVGHGTRQGPRP